MGVDIHITRAEHWTDSEEKPIKLEEWKTIVDEDPDLEFVDHIEDRLPDGQILRIPLPKGSARWTNPRTGRVERIYRYSDGEISLRFDLDEDLINKTLAIAKRLGAKVEGDEGDLIDENGEWLKTMQEDLESFEQEARKHDPWYKRFWRKISGGE